MQFDDSFDCSNNLFANLTHKNIFNLNVKRDDNALLFTDSNNDFVFY